MHTPRILTKACWYPNAQKPAPQRDSLQVPSVIEESSEDARRPSRLHAIFPNFKQRKGAESGCDTLTVERTPGVLDSASQPAARATRPTRETGAVTDNLALAAGIVESISGAVDKFPLVGPAFALLSQILKTCREIKDMHEQRDVLVARLTKTAGDLHGTIMRMETNNHTHSTGRLKADIEEYLGLLQQASALMSDFDGQGRFRTTALQTEWAGKFTALNRELDLFGARFNVNRLADMQIEQGVIHRKVGNGQIEQGIIHKKVDDAHIAVLKEKLEKWLKPADMSDKQHETLKLHREGTGLWFLDGRQLTEWIEKPGSLWIEGNSGTGKSVISSTVIQKLIHDRPPSDHGTAAVGYFYFDFRDDKKQLVDTMLRSVVFQLSGQSLNPYAGLNSQYEKLSQGQTLPTTQDLLVFIELLSKLRTRTESSLHLLLTSQPRDIFAVAFEGIQRVIMESKTTQKDIEHFVSDEVRLRLKHLKHWNNWKLRAEEITTKVVEKSNGMFRLAACLIIEIFRHKLEPNLDTILDHLPNELYGIYDRFLETFEGDDLVYLEWILRWLLFSAKPLTLREIEDALAFDFSDPHLAVYDPSKRGENATILLWILGRTVVVSLAHASVADYLVSDKFVTKGRCDLTSEHSYTFLAQTCVGYLLHFESHPYHFEETSVFEIPPLTKQLSLDYPFARYAAEHWSHHLLRCHDRAALSTSTARLLVSGSRQYETMNNLYQIERWNSSPPPLYMCSLLGYREGVEYLLRNGADVNEVGGEFHCALQAASAKGHTNIICALLENGADINMADGWFGSALQAAAARCHTEVVSILCEKGADLNAAGGFYGSALQHAAAGGHTEVVVILIEKGADANAVGEFYGSALQHAAAGGHTEVVRILIKKGADLNTVGGYHGSALQAVAAYGHGEIVQILIEKGADVNTVGGKYGSALQAASKQGHPKIVQILRENGATGA
ncbi:hypothetical protein C8J57DRAFT_1570568 [Mycena rebaudengoi]|nr:hypothetical protein C8J57DRAFT_1570568 [Mycena rebaudengoi]